MVESKPFTAAYEANELAGKATAAVRAAADALERLLSTPSLTPRAIGDWIKAVHVAADPLDSVYDKAQAIDRVFVWADTAAGNHRSALELRGTHRVGFHSSALDDAIKTAEIALAGARAWLEVVDAGEAGGVAVLKRFEAENAAAVSENRRSLGRYR